MLLDWTPLHILTITAKLGIAHLIDLSQESTLGFIIKSNTLGLFLLGLNGLRDFNSKAKTGKSVNFVKFQQNSNFVEN